MKTKKRKSSTRKSFRPSKLTLIHTFPELYTFILFSSGAITTQYRSLLQDHPHYLAAVCAIGRVAEECGCVVRMGTFTMQDQSIIFELVDLLYQEAITPCYIKRPRVA